LKGYLPILFILGFSVSAFAQQVIEVKSVQIDQDQSLQEFVAYMESHSDIRFYYRDEWLQPITIKNTLSGLSLNEMLSSEKLYVVHHVDE